jgi:hypothetical protein
MKKLFTFSASSTKSFWWVALNNFHCLRALFFNEFNFFSVMSHIFQASNRTNVSIVPKHFREVIIWRSISKFMRKSWVEVNLNWIGKKYQNKNLGGRKKL